MEIAILDKHGSGAAERKPGDTVLEVASSPVLCMARRRYPDDPNQMKIDWNPPPPKPPYTEQDVNAAEAITKEKVQRSREYLHDHPELGQEFWEAFKKLRYKNQYIWVDPLHDAVGRGLDHMEGSCLGPFILDLAAQGHLAPDFVGNQRRKTKSRRPKRHGNDVNVWISTAYFGPPQDPPPYKWPRKPRKPKTPREASALEKPIYIQ